MLCYPAPNALAVSRTTSISKQRRSTVLPASCNPPYSAPTRPVSLPYAPYRTRAVRTCVMQRVVMMRTSLLK